MYKVKIALYLITVIIFLIVRIAIKKDKAHSKIFTGLFLLGVATTIVFLVIQLFTWDCCTIAEILFFATPIVAMFSLEYDKYFVEFENVKPTIICIIATVISFALPLIIYSTNIEYSDTPEIETKTYTITCDSEKISENQIYFQGTNEDKTQYYYHYLNGEEIITLTIDAEDMEKVVINHKEKPYLEKITSKIYLMDYNNDPATVFMEEKTKEEIKYKLYIPKGTFEEFL